MSRTAVGLAEPDGGGPYMSRTLVMDREQAQLDLAFDPRRMGPLLAEAIASRGARVSAGGCHILDAKYAPRERCTVLYELGDQLIVGFLRWDGEVGDGGGLDIPEAGMRVYRFPHDPALPGLPAALDPAAVARALEGVLGERVPRCAVTLLRYRPTRRVTLRVDLRTVDLRTLGRARRTLFVKVYHDVAKARGVESALRALAGTSAVRAGRLVVAPPIAVLGTLQWVLFDAVPGVPLDGMLARSGHAAQAIPAAAGALAALHRAGPVPALSRPVTAQLARVARRAERAAEVAPALGAAMAELAGALAQNPLWQAGQDEGTLIHGDCKPSQFLVCREGFTAPQLALLDFDSCGLGDPASDVGAFLASLRKLRGAWAGGTRAAAALGDGFLSAYCAAAGRGADFRARVAWYEALALLRKAQRAFARAPRSPLPAAILAEARECVLGGE